MIDIRWNPLDERAPVVPKCPACEGRLSLYDQKTDENYACHVCVATPGLAQPPVCVECGGTRVVSSPDSITGTPDASDCPACSGTGHEPWRVLVTVDVLVRLLHDEAITVLFATIAAHPEMQFLLPMETVASAVRARGWIIEAQQYGTPERTAINEHLQKLRGRGLCNTAPTANLTLLAVAHDQPSLDALLPAVLAVPAAAHGVWLKGLDGAVDLWTQPDKDLTQPHWFPDVLLLDEVGDMPRSDVKAMNWWASQAIWCDNAAAQAREAGVPVMEVPQVRP